MTLVSEKTLSLIAIALIAFLISLDSFIINVAVTTISGDLGVREDVATWLITVFSTFSTLFVPVAGYLSPRIGDLRLFIFGILLFLAASLGCALSSSFSVLLFFRTIQGAGAGLLVPLSLSLIIKNFPSSKRATAIGFWSFFVMVAPAMGPMIGGWVSDFNWKWMFYLNLPIGLFSLATILLFLNDKKETPSPLPFDWFGIFLLFTTITSLQMAMNRWNIDDWLRSPFIRTLFILAAISATFFFLWEKYHPNPFIPLAQFTKRSFLLPALTTGIGMSTLFSSFVLDALWVQEVLGYTPAWAGLSLTPVGILSFLMYPLIGRIVSLLDLRIWLCMSFLLYALTFFWLSHINLETPYRHLAFPRLVQGIGFALFTVPNSMYIMKGVKENAFTEVIALFSFTRMLFVGFGVALGVTLWFFRQAYYQTIVMAKSYLDSPEFQQLLATFSKVAKNKLQTVSLANDLLTGQSSTLALADIYYLFAFIFLLLASSLLLYEKP